MVVGFVVGGGFFLLIVVGSGVGCSGWQGWVVGWVWVAGRGGFVLRCSKHNVEYFLEHFPRVQTNIGKTNIFQ